MPWHSPKATAIERPTAITRFGHVDRPWTPVVLPDLPPPAGAYSPGVRTANAGQLLFVSGQTPRDQATGEIIDGDVEAHKRRLDEQHDLVEVVGHAGDATGRRSG
jgi:enamine deaminase RidA (YjgF/YER057c/UK114 family)